MPTLFDYLEQTGESSQRPEPLSVGDLTLLIKGTLETQFYDVWVVGEISNLSRPRSGHCYLTLKDESAQLPAVVWRSSVSQIKFNLNDGLLVMCHGRIDVYPPHGKYQLVIDRMEPLGQGGLELAFRQLHAKLEAEGLFDPKRKRPIPKIIRRVAVVTSLTGAAIRDFLQVLSRRTKRIDVLLVPVRVQGDGASREMSTALETLNRVDWQNGKKGNFIDCIVVTRGGGSLEDLWAFNEEPLVRAVAESKIPVISAVGHEIDVTLCDLASDLRALTPSEAAERIAPDDAGLAESLTVWEQRLRRAIGQKIALSQQQWKRFAEHPLFQRPLEGLVYPRQKSLDHLDEQLRQSVKSHLERSAAQLANFSARLESLSPLSVLRRGYSLTFDRSDRLLTDLDAVVPGEEISTRFFRGKLRSVVQSVEKNVVTDYD
ncbi:MAG: exodeoxyribonuclease VII large subunit [Planctomycetaceae bacterium]|nr:exodeoxyribonuclease VII large subunit [Planctomycetaceae bacterium]